MKYHILNKNNKTIASFEHEHDRDVCFDCLNEDSDLERINDELY